MDLLSGHVIHYGLFLRDTLRDEPTESLDDIVFYMKSFIALLELASALFVICAGVKDGWIGNWSGNKSRKPCTLGFQIKHTTVEKVTRLCALKCIQIKF